MGFCGEKVSRCFIVTLNVIFMILGFAVAVPGIFILTDVKFMSDNISPLLDKINISGMSMSNMSSNLPFIFIITGGCIVFIAMVGMIGACCKVKCLLVLYAFILILLALVQAVILAFFFLLRSQLDTSIKNEFSKQLTSMYTSDTLDKSNEVSSAYNYMFMEMKCCGVDPVTGPVNDFDNTPWITEGSAGSDHIPKGCCLAVTEATFSTFSSASCTEQVTSGTYHSEGCYDKILGTFGTIMNLMGYIGIGILFLQILMIVFSYCLCCAYMKKRKEVAPGGQQNAFLF